MLTFKSALEIDRDQHLDPDQYHWEARSAHIFNHLWRDVTARLPLPNLGKINFDPVVAVYIGNIEKNLGDTGINLDPESLKSLGMATLNYFVPENKLFKCLIQMRTDAEGKYKHLDLDIFKHELIHCYQWLWDMKDQLDVCEQMNCELFSEKHKQWSFDRSIEHNELVNEHTVWVNDQIPIRANLAKQLIQPHIDSGSDIIDVLKSVIIPSEFDSYRADMTRYCEMNKPEKDMCIQAGRVWTPELSYSENLMIYQNVFTNTFSKIRGIYQKHTGKAGTRQQLTKLNIVPQLIAHSKASPELAPRLRFKAHTFLKDQYNYIENAEMQLAS